jgi:serine/threonine-protein kinase
MSPSGDKTSLLPPSGDADTSLLLPEGAGRGAANEGAGDSAASLRFRPVDVGARLGRYEIREELGSGGMATVYRARDTELRRDVALKVLFPHLSKRRDVVARFHREARAAAALDHPNIVRVYDTGGGGASFTLEGTLPGSDPGAASGDAGDAGTRLVDPPYLVMELVEGRSLDSLVSAHAPFLAEIVASIGMLLGSALAEAHRAGIVHRDVKPANVMVTTRGRVALTDFGVARIEGDDASVLTRSGMLLGTPAFMSPEQAMGEALDERSDIYSLGATLYQLATGAQPYSGSTPRVMAAIVEHKLVPPLQRNPAMGRDLARIIERMMAPSAAERFQRADEASEALRGVVEQAGMATAPAAAAEELARFFADPPAYTAAMIPVVVRATLDRARQAAEQRALPLALALADRALALEDGCREALALIERMGTHDSRRRWVAIAAALMLVAGASAAGVAVWRQRGVEQAATAPLGDAGVDGGLGAGIDPDSDPGLGPADPTTPAPDSTTAPAIVATSGADTGLPVQNPAPAPAQHRDPSTRPAHVEPRQPAPSHGGAARTPRSTEPVRAIPVDAGPVARAPVAVPTAALDAAPARATLSVDIRPWCDLVIDGVSHGRARRDRTIELAPGRHQLVCSQGPGRPSWRQTVTLAPGEHQQLTGSVLQPVRVHIQVAGGNAVRIGSQRHANGADVVLEPGRHRVAVLAGEREVAFAWVPIPAVDACTVRDTPALDCYR